MTDLGLRFLFRTLKKFKEYSTIGLLGFSLSLSLTLLAVLCILNETRYDTFHKDHHNIYRVTSELIYTTGAASHFARVMPWVGPYLASEFPDVEAVARFQKPEDRVIEISGQQFKESKVTWVDSSFFKVFDFELLSGNPDGVFSQLATAVVTKEVANKYFGTADVVGKSIMVDGNEYVITGVVRDGRSGSHFSFNILLNSYFLTRGWLATESGTHRSMFVYTYVKFKEGFQPADFRLKLKAFEDQYLTVKDLSETGLSDWRLALQPITGIHIGSHLKRELEDNMDESTMDLIILVTGIVVVMACFNYMIFITAIYSRRVKEIGIQRMLGATRWAIFIRSVGESIFFILIALLFGLVLLALEIESFGNLFGNGVLDLSILYSQSFIVNAALLTLLIGVLGGIYPAVIFGRIKPMNVFNQSSSNAALLLKLCGIQAIVSIVVIGFTYLVIQQMSFFNTKDYGFDKDNLLVVFAPPRWQHYEAFRNQLTMNARVSNVCQVLNYPGGFVEEGMTRAEGYHETFLMPSFDGCEDLVETMGLTLVAGRSLNKKDDWSSIIVNEAAVEKFGWKNSAIGRRIFTIEQRGVETAYTVVGVVKDFHYSSAHERIEPLRIHARCSRMDDILVNIQGTIDESVIADIKSAWERVDRNTLFDYERAGDVFARKYARELELIRVFTVFSIVAIIIAAMGFYGMSSIAASSQAREIGIRKVFGATELQIFSHTMRRFIKLLFLAAVVAVPLLYLTMNRWLSGFAYRVDIGLKMFIVPLAIIVGIAIVSFSYCVVGASLMRPVKALRSE